MYININTYLSNLIEYEKFDEFVLTYFLFINFICLNIFCI